MEGTSTGTILRCAAACASRGRPRRRRFCCFGRPRRRGSARPTRRHFPHSPSCTARARTPACSPIRLTPLTLEDGSCVRPGKRIHSSDEGLIVRARRVRPTPPRVRGERERHVCKSGAPSSKHSSDMAMVQLPCSDFVRLLPFVFRTTADPQLCITRHTAAASRSPNAFSKEARIRRFDPVAAGRPSTSHGRMAAARSWPC